MGLIQHVWPWDAQPQEAVGIAERWQSITADALLQSRRGVSLRGNPVVSVGSSPTVSTAGGLASAHPGGTVLDRTQFAPAGIGTTSGVGASFLLVFTTTTESSSVAFGGFGSDSGEYGNTLFFIGNGISGATVRELRFSAGGSGDWSWVTGAGTVINDGRVHAAIVTLDRFVHAGTCNIYGHLDGRLVATTTFTNPGIANAYRYICSGSIRRTTDQSSAGAVNVLLAAGFNRALSDAEANDLTADPWQLFEPRRIFVPVAAGGAVSLTVADSTHGHTVDSVGLTTNWLLTVAEAAHAHTADNVTLSLAGAENLVVAEAAHAHTVDSPMVSTDLLLAVAEAAHAHAADSPAVFSDTGLSIAEALHAHTADNITVDTTGAVNLTVQESAHAHLADALALTSAQSLLVADATHGHTVDGLTLSAGSLLSVQEALHAHAADNLTLTADNATPLLIADALHAHTAEGVAITVDAWLVVADAAHGHLADNVTLFTPGLFSGEAAGTVFVLADFNVVFVPADDRTVRVSS